MLEAIYKKFELLDQLYNERDNIKLEIQYKESHEKLKEIGYNLQKLYSFMKTNKISKYDLQEIKTNILQKLQNLSLKKIENKNFKIQLDILELTNYDISNILTKVMEISLDYIKKEPILKKIMFLISIKNLNKKIEENILNIIKKEIKKFVDDIDINPKNLDKWLNTMKDLFIICKNESCSKYLQDEYKKNEIVYFKLCINFICKQEKKLMFEDLLFMIHKIQTRSRLLNLSFNDNIKKMIIELYNSLDAEDRQLIDNIIICSN